MATLTMSTATATPAAAGVGGRFEFDDGGSYAGDWTDGMAHGHGVCTGPGGQGEFAGAWQLGFETSGVYRAAPTTTAAVYEGQWLQGRRHGLGVDSRGLPWATEAASPGGGPRWLYRGEWTQGFRGRYGVRQSTATGTKYEGTWTGGLQDGYGVETYADGGTYQGQWLRGVRHGYGIRQSVSYDLAARYPIHQAFPIPGLPIGGPPSPPEKEDDAMLRDRDLRIEESRGGFVLLARTTPLENDPHKHRMVLDKYGKPSIRKTIVKMMRQRSAGDVRESAPSSRSSSRMSGSVRSTSSQSSYASSTTGAGSVYSDEGSEASFVSQADLPPETFGQAHEIIERYLGEWKGDRRSGYGVAERTDGLRYEGEWASNRKHGYGATILRDGTRIEGKYKNNILVASSSGGKGSSKLFPLRSGKLRDRVDAAVKAAQHAAEVAKQKAEIACARMLSARMKAEQVEEVAKKAVVDAEMARAKAREYSPGIGQPGSNIIANRPTQETDIGVDFSYVDGFDGQLGGSPPIQAQTSPTRLLSFFKSKKSPSAAPSVHSDISSASYAGGGGGGLGGSSVVGGGGTLRNNRLNRSDAQLQQQPQQAGGYALQTPSTSASVSTGWTATPNGRGAGRQNGSTPGGWPPSSSTSSSVSASPSRPSGLFGGVDVQFDGMNRNQQQQLQQQQLQQQQQFMQQQQPQFQQQQTLQQQQQQQSYATQPVTGSGASPSTEFYSTAGLSSAESQLAGSRFNVEGPQVQAAWFQHPDSMQAGGAARWDAAGGQAFTAGLRPGDVTRSLYAHGDSGGVAGGPAGGGPAVDGWTSAEPSRSGTLRQAGLQRSFDDDMTPAAARYLASGERRKSLPSIVKQRTVVVEPAPASTTTAAATAARGPPGSRTTTETTGGVRPGDAVVKRAQVDLFVIENGVKRKVKPTETVDKGRAVPGERAVSKVSGGSAASPTAAVRRRFFTLEATRRAEKGSVPDVSAISNDEVLPREVVAMMSQRRREELIRQRAEAERRQGNQIVVCLGDLKDWCERRRVVVLLIAINISLASVFYSLLAQ